MNEINMLYNYALCESHKHKRINYDKQAFESFIIDLKNKVEDIARILCIDSNDFYDNILIKKNAISYDTLRDIANKVEHDLIMSEEDFTNHDIMFTAYEAGALKDEAKAIHILSSYLLNEENMKRFRKVYSKIEECCKTCKITPILKGMIGALDSADAVINCYFKDHNIAVDERSETIDAYKEFISFGSHHLLTSFIQNNDIELSNMIYTMEELYAMIPFIKEYSCTDKIDAPFIHFIIRRVERCVDLDALDIFVKIEGYSQINHRLDTMKSRLKCARYANYVPFNNLAFFNYFGKPITVDMLTEVENILIAEKDPCLEIVDNEYDDEYTSSYKHMMNCKIQNDIVRFCEAFTNMTVSSAHYANIVLYKMNNVDIGQWFDLVNTTAHIIDLYDALESAQIVTPLKKLVEEDLIIKSVVEDPMRPYSVSEAQDVYSLESLVIRLGRFIGSFTKIDFKPYGLEYHGGDKQNAVEKEEETQDPDDTIIELLKELGMIDMSFYTVDNAVLILSEYLPPKHAFLYNSEITLENIVKFMNWKCDNAKMCLISELKWILSDEITLKILKDFIITSGKLILFVDDIATENKIEPDIIRAKIKNKFIEVVKEKDISFFDYYDESILGKRINDLFKQGFIIRSNNDVTTNINCCILIGTLCNAYLEKCYRKGILKTYNRLVSALYGFCTANEVQIIEELIK